METPQMGVEATATFEGGPPSALALRKALQALGSIESIRQASSDCSLRMSCAHFKSTASL